jgi:dienelactone hydrolase
MNRKAAEVGQQARNTLQMDLLEKREMGDALSGLVFLRKLPDVDVGHIALIGHSFGGSLTLLMAEREPTLKARAPRRIRKSGTSVAFPWNSSIHRPSG